MNFELLDTPIKGLAVVKQKVFGDQRGFFMETYSERDFFELGLTEHFVQDNHSKSSRGVLRGLHFQREHTQGKLVRVIAGAVLDVAVDLRPASATYGQHYAVELSAENRLQLYIPPYFAHGFLTLAHGTEFVYKCTDYYHPASDAGLMWNDANVAVEWNFAKYGIDIDKLNISEKDKHHPTLSQIDPKTLWR